MGKRHRKESLEDQGIAYDSYDSDMDDELDFDMDDEGYLSKNFYITDWEDPSGSESRFSTRRKIERRNDLKELLAEFFDWDDIDLGNEFDLSNDW